MKPSLLADAPVPVRYKLAALWTAVMFCYVYGDYFSLFVPGQIQDIMDGKTGVGPVSPQTLLAFALLMTPPPLMIFLSLALRAPACRWVNIIFGTLYSLLMLLIFATTMQKWMLFYEYYALLEAILTGIVVWLAWKWPQE